MKGILKSRWLVFLKYGITIISFCYIAIHITSRVENISLANIKAILYHCNAKTESLFILLFLMFLNWTIEAVKWKVLINEIEKVSFLKSVSAVLTGVTVSFFTPNRSGEFVGRVMHLEPKNRVEASLATFIGSICQLTITLQAGLIALVCSLNLLTSSHTFRGFHFQVFIVLAILLMSFIIIFNSPNWLHKCRNIKWLKRYSDHFIVLRKITSNKILFVYLLSAGRYMVFSFQFYLLLKICGIELFALDLMSKIALSFFFTSLIPSIALGELGVRGSVNLHLFSLNHNNDTTVLVASFLLWLINLAIPALVGAICSFFIKWSNLERR